jgi:hypothetical protein
MTWCFFWNGSVGSDMLSVTIDMLMLFTYPVWPNEIQSCRILPGLHIHRKGPKVGIEDYLLPLAINGTGFEQLIKIQANTVRNSSYGNLNIGLLRDIANMTISQSRRNSQYISRL